jgi:hypothetical protein
MMAVALFAFERFGERLLSTECRPILTRLSVRALWGKELLQ